MPNLDVALVRRLLAYDPETGIFTRVISLCNRIKPGSVAGSPHNQGYVTVAVGGRPYLAHRLAWFYVNGEWPEHDIDHIDGNRSNNAYANLRPATRSLNNANAKLRSASQSGYKGVYFDQRKGRFEAYIRKDGRRRFLGHYDTAQEAHAAYVAAAERLFGEFARAA